MATLSNVISILRRLEEENMTLSSMDGQSVNVHQDVSGAVKESADSMPDQRWLNLFVNCFLLPVVPLHDDLLFFVRQKLSKTAATRSSIDGQSKPDQSPIIVKRRKDPAASVPDMDENAIEEDEMHADVVAALGQHSNIAHTTNIAAISLMPTLDSPIDWLCTFWLNLIVQLEYTLTVSLVKDGRLLHTTRKRVYATPYEQAVSLENASSNPRSSLSVRKAYTSTNENGMVCAYPLMYFCVDDHLDAAGEIVLDNDEDGAEYCVQVGIRINKCDMSNVNDKDIPPSVLSTSLSSSYAFPVDNEEHRVVIFQGAVSTTAIRISESMLVRKMGSLFRFNKQPQNIQLTQHGTPEYIAMKGPDGLGGAQAAVFSLVSSSSGHDNQPNTKLGCALSSVNIDWSHVAKMLMQWSRDNLSRHSDATTV